ncbi:putative lipid II flippase FtsW [Microcella frigidaquae]|uniref:Probable peptidoglycan glycosyltransferase FtsW n=1 Tax=Microcella frigidaquae TaxID=424758 RepID=A0A840X391_9MICO|nr:putative lipid II flippase FtsW [Microcella frigidaquae]MBB5616840.1 cell division protein FtsW [Microcella frigidaquae]
MTTVRPPLGRPGSEPGAPEPGRGAAPAVVAVRRLFGVTDADAMIVVGTVVFLVLFGLVMVLSSSAVISAQANEGDFFAVFLRQGLFALAGIPLMLVVSRISPRFWRKHARHAVMLGLALQVLVFTGLGYDYGGNRNWITLFGFSAQPSEFLKLALAVWLATVLADRANAFPDLRSVVIPALPVSGVAIIMVLAGQDLGTASIMIAIVLAALFFAGAPLRWLGGMVAVLAVGAVLFATSSASRSSRISVWLNGCAPEDYEYTCWQSVHALWALGSGGLFGVGLGNSATKWRWLPHAENDFIFAIIGEELGLIGAVVVLALFAVLAVALMRMVRRHVDPFARIATGAIMVWIVGQAFVNIAVVLGMLPVFGVPLPFISAGGSALLASLLAIGVVVSLSRELPEPRLRPAMPTAPPVAPRAPRRPAR